MIGNSYSFTPVRRRKAEFEDIDPDADSKHWTATRCNRLLRSLQSRIELLKKDAAQFIPTAQSTEPSNSTIATDNLGKRNNGALHSDSRGDDGAKPKKRVRVTYGGRSRQKDEAGRSASGQGAKPPPLKRGLPAITRPPGEISVETPILTRIRPDDGMTRASAVKVYGLGGPARKEGAKGRNTRFASSVPGISNFRSSTSLKQLQSAMSPKTYTLYIGIYNALESLLRTTGQSYVQAPERSNSLFSLCLRNVHQRIQLEEDWEAIDAKTAGLKSTLKRGISGEIYAQLEDIGTSENGWKHLRTVVREHGVHIVADAISSGLVNQVFGEALVMLCSQMGSYREAEVLLDALLLTMPDSEPATPYSRIADIQELAPLLALEKYVVHTGRMPEYFRMMTDIFGGGIVAIQWLATKELCGLWTRVFRAISAEPACQNATEFLQEILPLMLNASAGQSKRDNTRVSVAIGTTFSSVLATLSAVVILDEASTESDENSITERGRNVINILRHLHIEYSIPPTELRGQVSLVFLANLFATPLRDAGEERCEQLIRLLQQACQGSRGVIDPEIAEFMCSVARCCGRGLSGTGLEHFKRFSLLAEACISTGGDKKRHLLQNIIVSSAYVFSQQVPIAAHLDYADDIRAKFQIHPELGQGKLLGKPTAAFRWEEGISEWVAPTPAIKQTRHAVDPIRWEDSEVESPVSFRRLQKLRAPSFPAKRENAVGQRMAARVSDLIPSSPSTYRSDGTGYDERDTIFSDMTPPPRIASVFTRKSTALSKPTGSKKLGKVGSGSVQHGHGWSVYGEANAANATNAGEDTDEEDELSVFYVLPDERIPVMTEAQKNSRLSIGSHGRHSGILSNGKASRQMAEDDDFSGDELSF
ncbi:hypothetical protein VC83_05367 [Pseudogymnoascus destructans]|uniref:Uncharacterized protein n=2 Tax=Pseudogymnoascus destructans TaxID=655981 RepID=L8FZD5_PSED2|nr:uncharacterized protein VC83_05367 [Pseudogymnoascus destructans]ELR06375.1 hypothetical protein GMDG_02092 [Pseudogymnoascus destructans 20631-21]OAF57981.1 hypothetical protein VC83_05367 [Pseudogymnoascus destructans]